MGRFLLTTTPQDKHLSWTIHARTPDAPTNKTGGSTHADKNQWGKLISENETFLRTSPPNNKGAAMAAHEPLAQSSMPDNEGAATAAQAEEAIAPNQRAATAAPAEEAIAPNQRAAPRTPMGRAGRKRKPAHPLRRICAGGWEMPKSAKGGHPVKLPPAQAAQGSNDVTARIAPNAPRPRRHVPPPPAPTRATRTSNRC